MKIDVENITTSRSSREGGRIKLFVLHTTEGFDTNSGLEDLGNFWDGAGASSHFGTDRHGRIARYVPDADKSWTQCYLNPVALSVEQCGYASLSREDWFHRHAQLHAAAELVQYAHNHYDLPIRRAFVVGLNIVRSGVCQHKHLGSMGCGHSDCGSGYPERYVRLLARYFVAVHKDKNSSTTKKLRRKINRIRRRYGVAEITA